MSRIFTSGFEENSGTTTMTAWTTFMGTFDTTSPHSGTYNGRVTLGQTFTRRLASAVTAGTYYTRFYWKTSTTASDNEFFRIDSSGGARNVGVYKLAGGTIKLQNGATLSIATTTFAVSINTWYRIEIQHVLKDAADPTGSITLNIYVGDSTTASDTVSITNEDTLNTNIFTWKFQEATTGSTVFSFDDVAINDTTGTFQNSWCGPEGIALIKPNGQSSVQWSIGGTGAVTTNWGGVQEVPGTPDDDVTYNFDVTTKGIDRLTLTSLPAEVPLTATLTVMDVYARVGASSSSGTMALQVWDQVASATQGPIFTVNTSTWRILTTAEHLSVDVSGYTVANLNQFNAGYLSKSGNVEKRITTLWANVGWVPVSSTTSLFTASNPLNGLGVGGPFFTNPLG